MVSGRPAVPSELPSVPQNTPVSNALRVRRRAARVAGSPGLETSSTTGTAAQAESTDDAASPSSTWFGSAARVARCFRALLRRSATTTKQIMPTACWTADAGIALSRSWPSNAPDMIPGASSASSSQSMERHPIHSMIGLVNAERKMESMMACRIGSSTKLRAAAANARNVTAPPKPTAPDTVVPEKAHRDIAVSVPTSSSSVELGRLEDRAALSVCDIVLGR